MNQKNILLFIATLLFHSYAHSMHDTHIKMQLSPYYNPTRENQFSSLPDETVKKVFSHCTAQDKNEQKAIKKTLKQVMTLGSTSKQFHRNLDIETIGKMFAPHNQQYKDALLKQIAYNPHFPIPKQCSYKHQRFFSLALMHAGADANKILMHARLDVNRGKDLITLSIERNDLEFVAKLVTYNIDLHQKNCTVDVPIFFTIRTLEMAQICEKHINVHSFGNYEYPNVLWYIIKNYSKRIEWNSKKYDSVALVNFYLNKGVSTQQCDINKEYLLHALADCSADYVYEDEKNANDFIQITQLLIDRDPTMINALDKNQETPIDHAKPRLVTELLISFFNFNWLTPNTPHGKFIDLLLELHGSKTSKDLSPHNTDNH
jgi:hypothetical protein